MPSSKLSSPFAQPFITAIKNGTPCWNAVQLIAFKSKKTPNVVFNSLCKAGLCFRQKINGQWIYWPCQMPKKGSVKQIKSCQANMWQWYIEWCLASGFCTPVTLYRHIGTEQKFTNWCSKFWARQFGGTLVAATPTKRSKPKRRKSTSRTAKSRKPKAKLHKPKSKSRKPKARSRKSRSSAGSSSYKFPTFKFPKYRKVA